MNLWFARSDRGLRMQLGAAFPIGLAGRLVHALLLMLFMIIDLDVPTNGTVVATDASKVKACATQQILQRQESSMPKTKRLSAHSFDSCFGLVVLLRSFTSWRGAFDELDIILQHTSSVAVSYLVAAPEDLA